MQNLQNLNPKAYVGYQGNPGQEYKGKSPQRPMKVRNLSPSTNSSLDFSPVRTYQGSGDLPEHFKTQCGSFKKMPKKPNVGKAVNLTELRKRIELVRRSNHSEIAKFTDQSRNSKVDLVTSVNSQLKKPPLDLQNDRYQDFGRSVLNQTCKQSHFKLL